MIKHRVLQVLLLVLSIVLIIHASRFDNMRIMSIGLLMIIHDCAYVLSTKRIVRNEHG